MQIEDKTVPACSSASLHTALVAKGVRCELMLMSDLTHIDVVVLTRASGVFTTAALLLRDTVLRVSDDVEAPLHVHNESVSPLTCKVCGDS
jgi:hypothetical protein